MNFYDGDGDDGALPLHCNNMFRMWSNSEVVLHGFIV